MRLSSFPLIPCRSILLFSIAVVLCICDASAYMRGRPKNQNNTPITDQGSLLRGITANIFNSSSTQAWSVAYWRQAADSGFNSMRLGVQFAQPWQTDLSVSTKLPFIEQSVAAAESAGMYVGIDYHDISGTEAQRPYDFWCAVAPKYRDKTHVLYEVSNEANYPTQEQEALYRIIRAKAPLTMIITNSFSIAGTMVPVVDQQKKIDYSNAVVGYHPYSTTNPSGIVALKAKYPCMTTELTPYPGLHDWSSGMCLMGNCNDSLGWIRWHEQQKISWWLWGVSSASSWGPVLVYARRDNYMWQKDNYTTAPVVPFSVTFKGGADTIYYSDSLILAWECPQATSVTIDNGIGTVSTFGSRKVIPTANTTYTLTAQGPGGPVTRQVTVTVLPLRTPENPTNTTAGLTYRYYESNWGQVPSNFASYTPVKTGTCSNFDLSVANRNQNIGIRYDGYLNIPSDGIYTFTTAGMTGTRLYIGTTVVVDNSSWQGPGPVIGFIGLKAGKHAFHLDYVEQSSGGSISATMNWQPIPNAILSTSGVPVGILTPMRDSKAVPGSSVRGKTLEIGGSPLRVEFADIRGRLVPAAKTNGYHSIDLSNLPTGFYSVNIFRAGSGCEHTGILIQ